MADRDPHVRDAYDVLVVGSGGAGLQAAIAAAEAGSRVAVITKGLTRYSGATASANFSYCAQFGYFGANDTPQAYTADIVRSGQGLSDPALAAVLAAGAAPAANALEGYGVAWRRDPDGRQSLATFGGHAHPRAIHVGLRTGKIMMSAFARQAERMKVDIREYAFAVEVLLRDGRVCGLLVYDIASGELRELRAAAVVIATGGPVAMFELHTNPDEMTGDGHALAYDAGAELIDLEFIQHYPTVFVAPPAARGLHFPTGRLLGFGARLINASGEEFFHKNARGAIHLATRDEVARAIALEVRAGGGTPLGGVYVDARAMPAAQVRDVHFEAYYQDLGLHAERDLQEVSTAAHYGLGGIRIDPAGRTSVPGLYAAGEVTGGLHGANRLTGTALPEAVVFGAAAGAAAAREGRTAPRARCESRLRAWVESLLTRAATGPMRPVGEVTALLRGLMQRNAGVLKTGDALRAALDEIAAIERDHLPATRPRALQRRFNWEVVQCLELRCMLIAARLHCLAALAREESRGAHQRLDWPERDDARWLTHLVVRGTATGPALRREPLRSTQ